MLKTTVANPTGAAMGATLGIAAQTDSFDPADSHQPLLCDQLLSWADRNRRWLFLSMLVIYVAAFNGQWRMEPDAALYLSIGRNLAQGKGFTYLGHANHLAYPGWPYLIALTFKLFGTNTLIPVHALMLLIAWGALAASYRTFLLHSGRPTAVVVTLGLGLTKTFFAYGFELWSDMPFTLAAMAFLAGFEGVFRKPQDPAPIAPSSDARWFDWALLFGGLGLAIVMRPTMWPLLIAVAATILLCAARNRANWRSLGITIIGLFLFAAAILCLDPRRTSHAEISDAYEQNFLSHIASGPVAMLRQTLTQNAPELLTRAASDVLFQVRMGWFNIVLSLVVLVLGVGLFRYRALWGFWFCFLTGTILVILPIDRYFLPVTPLLIFAWWQAMVWLNRSFAGSWSNWAFAGLLIFGVGMNLSKVGGIIMQQRSPDFLAHFDRGTYAVVPRLAHAIQDNVSPDALILVEAPYGRVLAFLSQRDVTNAPTVAASDLASRSVYVIEPAGPDIRQRLQVASLVEGPLLASVNPPAGAGPNAVCMSLHAAFATNAKSLP